ncbi:MAG TPA: hypothetical protein VJB90_02000 [Candidatus Nanoarchaeia archaeon]|nr:hypothetical protein [Candidatus Nanoarchaeia archaeon]
MRILVILLIIVFILSACEKAEQTNPAIDVQPETQKEIEPINLDDGLNESIAEFELLENST